MVDNQRLSPSSLQSSASDPGAPATSNASSSASTPTNSDVIAQLPLAGLMIAGILVGVIVIAAIVVICFLQRRRQHPRRRRCSFEAQVILQPDSRPHRHSRSQFLRDENQENATPKKKYRRYSRRSRYSTRIMELDRNSVPPGKSRSEARESSLPSGNRQPEWHSGSSSTNSTVSLNTNEIGVNRPHHQIVDASQNSITIVPSTISIISSKHDEQYSPPPTTELPLQPLSSRSEFIKTPSLINPSLLLEVGGERLNTLIQQRASFLASGNTSDKVVSESLLLEKQIENLRRQDVSLVQQDNPPPYEQ